MAYQLRLEEVLQALIEIEHPDASAFVTSIGKLTSQATVALAAKLDVTAGQATYDLGFIAAPFAPKFDGQEIPSVLKAYDNVEEWEFEPAFLGPTF